MLLCLRCQERSVSGQLAVAAVALSPKRDPDDPLAKALGYLAVPTGSQRVMLLASGFHAGG